MSKEEGKKIGIKFTDDLIGGVTGNESAFKVTGKEYKYINGPLVDKNYIVNKVERYPIQKLWQIQNELGTKINVKDTVDGIKLVGVGGNTELWDGTYQANTSVNSSGNLAGFSGARTTKKITVKTGDTYIFGGIGDYCRLRWVNDAGSLVKFEDGGSTSTTTVPPYTTVAPVGATGVYYFYAWTLATTSICSVLHSVPLTFVGSGTYETEIIPLTVGYRIGWALEKPNGTNIIIEYTTGETQGQWIEVANGEVVDIDTNIWIRATLSTSDASLTPTLYDLWLEDSSAPQDKILITMEDIQGRFPTVEGDLTVEYDASIGNLTGQGGAVDSFVTVFTPTDLVPEHNPGIVETITGAPTIAINYLEVTYHKGYAAETITAAPAEITVAFLSTEVINP